MEETNTLTEEPPVTTEPPTTEMEPKRKRQRKSSYHDPQDVLGTTPWKRSSPVRDFIPRKKFDDVQIKKHKKAGLARVQNYIQLQVTTKMGQCTPVCQDNRGDDDGMTDVVQSATMEKFKKGDVKVLVATSVGTEGIDVPNCDNVISYNYTGNEITKIQMSGRSRKKGGMTMVFGNEAIVRRENINAYKAHMMYRAMGLVREMKQADLERIIGKFQKEAMIRAKIQKELEQLKIKQTNDNEYILKCKHCTTFACKSSDIRKVLTFRFVIDTEFDSRIEIRPHRKPLIIEGFKKQSKMYCKNCPMAWGIICTYQGIPCRALKIENFTLMNMERGQINQPCKIWDDIPFSVPEVKPEEFSKLVPARE